jgi:nickel/cobalt transporter (NicO) family protein
VKRFLLGAAVALGVVVALAGSASAHPLGNFTINQFSGLHVGRDAIVIDLVTDMAEIPTYQVKGDIDANGNGTFDSRELASWRSAQCAAQADALKVEVDGQAVRPVVDGAIALSFPPGQGGLPTLRLECPLRATLSAGAAQHTLVYEDHNFAGRLGWREIIAVGEGAAIHSSDVSEVDVTNRLTQYPKDVLSSPPNQRAATVRFEATATAGQVNRPATRVVTTPLPRGIDRLTRSFTDLVAARRLTVAFGLAALGLALLLGSIHALAPGHGKTVMAAYIVGERGTWRHAALIGLSVTATHTAGVVALGVILTTTTVAAPERLYPWFGLMSGLLLAGIGVTLVRRALRNRRRPLVPADLASLAALPVVAEPVRPTPFGSGDVRTLVLVGAATVHEVDTGAVQGAGTTTLHEHHDDAHHHHEGGGHRHRWISFRRDEHHHEDGHTHDDHSHDGDAGVPHYHGGRLHTHRPMDPTLGWKSLMAVGFAGGLVPNPSALVVLLGAIALGRTWFGLLLVVAYGVGMAVTLTSAGLLLVRARSLLDRFSWSSPTGRVTRLTRFLPLVTSSVIIVAGAFLAANAIAKL